MPIYIKNIPNINFKTSVSIFDEKTAAATALKTPHNPAYINAFLSISLFLMWEYSAAADVGKKYIRFMLLASLWVSPWMIVINTISSVPPPIPQPERIPVAIDAIKLRIGFSLLRK